MSANLLHNRTLRAFLTSGLYPTVFQAITAAFFVLVVFQLLVGPTSAHDNLGTALTWVLWWPIIPIVFVVLGRFWCAICPFGTLSDLIQKFLGNQRPVPTFLKKYGIWIIDALFILITWADHIWGIVENPWGSAMLLLALTTGVVASGAFFVRRTWCRYLCFLGGLAGNYSRSGIVALRANQDICATCKARAACYNGNEKGPGCPMFEFPRQMDSNAQCNLCAACLKTCPNDAIQLTLRPPTKELWFIRKPKFEEAFLAIVIMGIVFVQNVTMLEVWTSMLQALQQFTGTESFAVNFTITFLIAMAIPLALFGLAAWVARRFNRDSFSSNFAKFGYAIIPLDIAGHMAHNLFHLLAEGKAVVFTAQALLGQPASTESAALLPTPTIQVLQYILLAIGVIGSLYAVHAIGKNQYGLPKRSGTFASYGVLIGVFLLINAGLFALPMSMRMHGSEAHSDGVSDESHAHTPGATVHMDHHQTLHGGQLGMGDGWHIEIVSHEPGTYVFYLFDDSGHPIFPEEAEVQLSLIDGSGNKAQTLVAQRSAKGNYLIAKCYPGYMTTDRVRVRAILLGSKPVELNFKMPYAVNMESADVRTAAASGTTGTPTPVPAGSEARIDVGDNYFYPETVVVKVGATVRWDHVGSGGPQHDVMAEDRSWGTLGFGIGANFRMTFSKEGVYPYVCTHHSPGMRGEVIVVQ